MPNRKGYRLVQIREMVEEINFNCKGFKQAVRLHTKEGQTDFNALRHWTNKDGEDVYIATWNIFRDELKDAGTTSKILFQKYHHEYQNKYNERIFVETLSYLRKRHNFK